MPRVVEFAGILIAMYGADHNPPHVHVSYGEEEALVMIKTGEVLVGSLPDDPDGKMGRSERITEGNQVVIMVRELAGVARGPPEPEDKEIARRRYF